MRRPDTRFTALLLLAALPPAVEAFVLVKVNFISAQGLPPQITAVWPYDTYHDLRWIFVYHNSWLAFGVLMVAAILLRGLLTTGLVALAWPGEVDRPSVRWLLTRNTFLSVLVALFVSPWAVASVAASVVALSWLLIASLLPMFLLAPFLQRAAVVGPWWRGLPSWPLVGWSSLNFVLITVTGAVAWSVPKWWTVPVAGVAGILNGLLWQRTVRAAVLAPPPRLAWVPVTPLVALLVLAVPFAVPALIRLLPGGGTKVDAAVLTKPLPPTVRHAVIVLAGYGSTYDGTRPPDPNVQRFSYRGLGPTGEPLPYGSTDTFQSISSSVDLLADQVERLHRRTNRPVALIGQSQGAMVARTYLAQRRHPAVDSLAMFSPLVNAGRAYYPPPGDQTGWGVATGWQLRVIFGGVSLVRPVATGPDEPFIRSLLDDAPFYRNNLMCPVPGVRLVAFLPTATATEAPPGDYTQIPVFQQPGVHGTLLGRRQAQENLIAFITGQSIDRPRREYYLLQRISAAWQAPPLAIWINPAWQAHREPDPAFTGKVCLPN
ncbi:esterase/lipase family protein [Micromonospora yangpuensis]|uniref:Serine aminopeptidase, S33 n=1 Tax=Micromonospora yangpuensis TaxID=683228 RepID=A0A1C6TWR0_9ACTN|nr:alpha/beta hydrolase [Micromonospora yangpuensis]GGM01597.1 hypothetical protein GCM10012279_18980 [Micromonospora yangpuensis]SCL46250.1 Serine aminopeptidase, S33 [Micromonospora yangpuensis]